MNIFEKIRKFFSRDISLEDNQQNLIIPMTLRGGVFKIGAKVEVPSGFSFVVAYKGKPYDILQEGTHQISPLTMPNIGTKLKLYVADQKGRVPQKFKADAYFINKKPAENIVFSSYRTLKFFEDKTRFKVSFVVSVSYEIEKQDKFVKICLSNLPRLKAGDSEIFVCSLLTEHITDKLDKQHYSLLSFQSCDNEIKEFFEKNVGEVLKDIGLKLVSLQITEMKVKTKEKRKEKSPKEEKQINITPKNILDKVVFAENKEQSERQEVCMYEDEKLLQKTERKNREFVDLSLNELYSDKAKSKICPHCFANNIESAKFCYSCRNKLSEENDG